MHGCYIFPTIMICFSFSVAFFYVLLSLIIYFLSFSLFLFLSFFLGSGSGGSQRRQSPVEYRGNLCVCPSVHRYICLSPPCGPSEAGSSLSEPLLPAQGQPLRGLSQPLRGLSQPLRGLGQPLRGLRGEGLTGGRTYGRTDSPCILQDFVSSGSLRSRCPAHITATITKY